MEKETFLNLIQNNSRFAQYYLKQLSEEVVGTAYSELRSRKVKARSQDAFYLFSLEIKDVIKRAPEFIHWSKTIREAAARMSELAIGSLLVQDQRDDIAGIITDKDLRTKVVATGRDYDVPVVSIMSSPIKMISAHSVCFDALLQMMNEQVHHLAVERGGEIIGVVTSHDIMVHQGTSPLYLFREIIAQRKIEGLYSLSQKVPLVVRTLIEEGAKANNITRMITVSERSHCPSPFDFAARGNGT